MKITRLKSLSGAVDGSWKEAALLGTAALIILGLTGFSFWLDRRVLDDRKTADGLNRFNAELVKFVQTLRTVESSQRGFLITNRPDFLKPYEDMGTDLADEAARLQTAIPAELIATSQPAISSFGPAVAEKLSEMNRTIALTRAGNREAAVAIVTEGYGKRLTSEVEQSAQIVVDRATKFIDTNNERTAALLRLKFITDALGAIAVLTLSSLALQSLLRSNSRMQQAEDVLKLSNADLEELVQQRTFALKRANDEVQRFAYIVSHDLRSPLVNIMGFTSELDVLRKEIFDKLKALDGSSQDNERLGAEFDEALRFIKTSIGRMDRLIAAILRISRDGNRPLAVERIDMHSLVESIVAGLEHQVREKDAEIEIASLPAIAGDKLALEQIFANIIENALKFLKSDRPGHIKVSGRVQGQQAVFSISDNGRGIDPKDHGRIFELFRRSGPQDVPGEGMGLAYVSALVRRLGGEIEVESALGKGTSFRIAIPAAFVPEKRLAA